MEKLSVRELTTDNLHSIRNSSEGLSVYPWKGQSSQTNQPPANEQKINQSMQQHIFASTVKSRPK